MKRGGVVRFQVLLIVVLAGLLFWRASRGPDLPDAAVSLAGLDTGTLYSTAFRVEADGRVRIDATGSVEESGGTVAAAYPWILNASNRSVVWIATPDSVGDDTTVFSVVDTVRFAAGDYMAWFTTVGSNRRSRSSRGFLGLRHHWTNDASEWRILISPVDSIQISKIDEATERNDRPDLVWQTGPVRNRQDREVWLSVESDTSVHIRVVADLCDSGCDEARIENATNGQVVWTTSSVETQPAGGSELNRAFEGDVMLPRGIYRVKYEANRSQAFGSWEVNPPWDPVSWGMTIEGGSGLVREFDPWETSEPLVAMLSVGDDELLRTAIEVTRPTRVAVDATGELWSTAQRYDYAWIEREDRSRLWEMTYERTMPAGGDDSNRREVAFLDLDPGRYVVYYQSDDAHAYGSWSRSRPDHPDRWGVALFSLDPDSSDTPAVRVLHLVPEVPPDVPDVPGIDPAPVPTPIPPVAGETLFSATGLGNDEDRSGEFVLSRNTRVRIVALGEISRQRLSDFGWIESESGDYVWEMSLGNTKPAGGDDSFRRFDSVITLPAGRYTARFRTDFSNAFGDFRNGEPRDPSSWGMRIVRMPE